MSTNEWRDCESQTLPATWEEYQRARREAFLEGSVWTDRFHLERGQHPTYATADNEARRRYPIRTTMGERVAMNGGWLFFDADGHLRWESEQGHFGHTIAPSALEHLRANPFEEVEQ